MWPQAEQGWLWRHALNAEDQPKSRLPASLCSGTALWFLTGFLMAPTRWHLVPCGVLAGLAPVPHTGYSPVAFLYGSTRQRLPRATLQASPSALVVQASLWEILPRLAAHRAGCPGESGCQPPSLANGQWHQPERLSMPERLHAAAHGLLCGVVVSAVGWLP